MSLIVELPFGLSDLEKVFMLTEMLENKDELVREFLPQVSKFLVKSSFFTGHTKLLYQAAFDDLIVSLIKKQVVQHFNTWTPEEILLLCDKEFLKMITDGFYFEPDTYSKEGINDGKH